MSIMWVPVGTPQRAKRFLLHIEVGNILCIANRDVLVLAFKVKLIYKFHVDP